MLRVIEPEDFDRVCQFTAEVFCSYEPMCVALAVKAADFVQQFSPILEACCTSGLSTLLESNDADTKDIMSLSLALTFDQYNAVELSEHPSFTPVLSVFNDLAHPIEKEPGAAMSFIWATHSSHMNKGYTKRVVQGTVKAAEAAGLSWMVTDVTNVVSQHVAMKYFGYQPIAKVRMVSRLEACVCTSGTPPGGVECEQGRSLMSLTWCRTTWLCMALSGCAPA